MNTTLSRAIVIACLLLAGCGGGEMEARIGGGGTGAPLSVGVGAVSGFGSVIVNGERYDEREATIVVDERPDQPTPVPTTALALGMQLTIEHRERVITRATAHAEVIGPVTSIGGASLTVLGQNVLVTTSGALATAFDGFVALSDLSAGSVVEVHGQRLADEQIAATLVRLRPAASVLRVAGTVKNLVQGTFAIGALTIQTTGAEIIPASQTLANGARVAVWTDLPLAGSQLAARVIRIGRSPVADGARVSVEGPIVSLQAPGRFALAGMTVEATAAQFSGGTIADLAAGRKVRVSGTLAGSTLRAASIEFPAAAVVELTGAISAFNAADQPFRVRGAMARVTPQTTYEAGNVANLGDGVQVSLLGNLVGGVVEASKLALLPAAANTQRAFVGPIASAMPVTGGVRFRIEAIDADFRTTAATEYKSGSPAELTAGRRVKIQAHLEGAELVADEVQWLDNPAQPQQVELQGVASEVSASAFKVDGRTVGLSSSTVYLRDGAAATASALVEGAKVEVESVRLAGKLVAITVDVQTTAGGELKIRGIVSERTSADALQFRVGSQLISVAFNPQVIPGNRTVADIRNGHDLEVAGTLVNGVLRASRVKFR